MIFALDKDDGGVFAFPTPGETAAHCKGIDVQDGYWLFFSDDGSPLEARFGRVNTAGDFMLNPGTYILQRAMSGLWLHERLAQIKSVAGGGFSTVAELVDTMKANRARRAALRNERG
jgi:hypothetical protein